MTSTTWFEDVSLTKVRCPFGDNLNATWRTVGAPTSPQGWKLHLSCRSDEVNQLFDRALPVLHDYQVAFKGVVSLRAASALNWARKGSSQVGKIITVYPEDPVVVGLGSDLAAALRDLPGPVIDNEIQVDERAPVFARFGRFVGNPVQTGSGVLVDYVHSAGRRAPDNRGLPMHLLLGVPVPFPNGRLISEPRLVAERFLARAVVHEGAHGRVRLALDTHTQSPVALKTARRHAAVDDRGCDAVGRLQHEFDQATRLASVGLCLNPVYFKAGTERAALVTPWAENGDLESYRGTLAGDPKGLAALGCRLIRLVQRAHDAGFIIGDVQPRNFLCTGDGDVLLTDLAFSRSVEADWPAGTMRGYSHPDLFVPHARSTTQSDLFALGRCLIFLATGVKLHEVGSSEGVLKHLVPDRGGWALAAGALAQGTADSAEVAYRALAREARRGRPPTASRGATRPPQDRQRWRQAFEGLEKGFAKQVHLAEPGRPGPLPPARGIGLYSGLSGLGIAALRPAALRFPDWLDVAERLASDVWAIARRAEFPSVGLTGGGAGPALFLAHFGRVTGNAAWSHRARRLVTRISTESSTRLGVTFGVAGCGLTKLWLLDAQRSRMPPAYAEAAQLVAAVRRTAQGVHWPVDVNQGVDAPVDFGLSHGVAGILWFLSEFAAVARAFSYSDETTAAVEELLAEGTEHLHHHIELTLDTALTTSPSEYKGADSRWCSGMAGWAHVLIRLEPLAEKNRIVARTLVRAAAARTALNGANLCHGLAGLLEVVIDLEGESPLTTQLASQLLDIFTHDEGDGSLCAVGEAGDRGDTGLMTGVSGILGSIGRLQSPTEIGHFLDRPAHAFRTTHLSGARERARQHPATHHLDQDNVGVDFRG